MENSFAHYVVKHLTQMPNRAVASTYEHQTLDFLSSLFSNKKIERESFYSPKNYLYTIAWLLLGVITSILILDLFPIISLLLSVIFISMAFLFFNWMSSPISRFPPLVKTHNLVISELKKKPKKIILMAHYDTAPISILYKPSLVGNFRKSLNFNILLLLLTEILVIFHFLKPNNYTQGGLYVLALYFFIQLFVASFDFFRFGYSNGASDNATGVAAVAEVAKIVWEKNLKNTEIQVLFTGAEEVGMLGARFFLKKHFKEFDKNTMVINFDTLGAGKLNVIKKTGSWGTITYDNELVKISDEIVKNDQAFLHVKSGEWHTADFDSVWFNRVGIPSLTLAALDSNGKMPNIHRETDIYENVNFTPMNDAIALAVKLCLKIDRI